jgi:hypothetical protein
MPWLTGGLSRRRRAAAQAGQSDVGDHGAVEAPLTLIRVGCPRVARELGRREQPFSYGRLIVPSLVIDHTELMLRRRGAFGGEGFGVWAGTLAGADALVSTLVLPEVRGGRLHGEVPAAAAARLFSELDEFDLVALAQIHSHPGEAFLSETDAERPLMAVPGFLSIVIPEFGFVDLANVEVWRAYEYRRPREWRELDAEERQRRLIIDPSLLDLRR